MTLKPGAHELGPEMATIRIETTREGAAAKAGHDLVIELGSWRGQLDVREDGTPASLRLSAETGSLHVVEGTGGVMALTENDKVEIKKTLEDEVLEAQTVEFASTEVSPDADGSFAVRGELEMNGAKRPLTIELTVGADGGLSGHASLKQSGWGIKPYSGLFGTLKVADAIEITARPPGETR